MSRLTDYSLLSFDVYGTLIDWESGVLTALEPLLKQDTRRTFTRRQLLDTYHHLESTQQRKDPGMPYSQILATIHPLIAQKLGLPAPEKEENVAFGDSIGHWPAFPDTVNALTRLSQTYKLVVLSNVDRDSFSRSNSGPLGGVRFDGVLTAQDMGSYKPDLRNFERMLQFAKSDLGVDKEQVLQIAQSQFHDHQPAREIGIKSVWIVRPGAVMGNREEEIYDWKFDTLGEMADAVDKEKQAT